MTFKYARGEEGSASHPGHETQINGLKPHTLYGQENTFLSSSEEKQNNQSDMEAQYLWL